MIGELWPLVGIRSRSEVKLDMDELKEEIRLAMDGLGGNDVACAAACVALEDLDPAQGENWSWVQAVLADYPMAKEAALVVRQEMEERNIQSRAADQKRFEAWLTQNAPYLSILWDFERHYLSLPMVDSYLATATSEQAIMCRFAAGVWQGSNDYQFDLVSAAGILKDEQKSAIAAWFTSPFWP